MCFHTTGTYLWLYSVTWYMEANGNKKFHDKAYHVVCDSALWTYVTHYFWITLIAYVITTPLGCGQPSALFILFFGTHFLAYGSYELLGYLCSCGWRKKIVPIDEN